MLLAQGAFAALTYNNGDLILGFRKAGGSSNLEVDLGSITQIKSIAGTGTILSFSQFTAGDITAGVGSAGSGSLNNAIWSVSGAVNLAGQITGAGKNTLWLTSARDSAALSTQTTPWTRGSSTTQGNTVAPVLTVGTGFAAATGNAGSTTAAVIADGANSYHDNITDNGNFNAFGGNIENTLGATFVSSSTQARSDLYEMQPGSGNGTYLGYFELTSAGALSFVAVPEPGLFGVGIAAGLMVLTLVHAHRKSEANS